MKICILPLNGSSPWGGSEVLWTKLAQLWHDQGLSVSIVIRDWPSMPAPIVALESAGIPIYRYTFGIPLRARVANKIRSAVGLSPIPESLESHVRSIAPDLVLLSADGMGGLPGMQLASKLNIPYCYIMQSNTENFWPSDYQRDRFNAVIDNASGVICFVSENNRDIFELQLGRRLSNSLIVRNPHAAMGINVLPWPESEPGIFDPEHDELRFAFVGRQEPVAKGQDVLFRVLATPQWMSRRWSLKLYGDGSSYKSVIDMSKMLGISDRLMFFPRYQSIVDVWRNSHVLLLASRYEGLPLVLVEAMSLGRPAVVTDVADCANLLRDGIDGFVAEYPSVSSYARAMERLWLARSSLVQMGLSASQRVKDFFPADPVQATSNDILSKFFN